MKILETLKSMLHGHETGNSESVVVAESFSSLEKLNEIVAERRRLRGLRDGQVDLAPSLKDEIAKLDGQRIELLTESLVDGSDEKSASARELDEQIQGKKKRLADIEQVVAGIDKKIAALDSECANLEMHYRRDLGQFLNGIYAELADEYNRKAADIADVVFQITALRNVMLFHKAGNTGYYDARFFLPKIVPGLGVDANPVIDASIRDFFTRAKGFENAINEQLKQAGFHHRFD